MRLKRHFSRAGTSPFDALNWIRRGPVESPSLWSETAVEIAASRYFRKRGLSADFAHGETSLRQLLSRVCQSLRQAGEWLGYFEPGEGETFENELAHILVHQLASFNSPVYFNVGVFPSYGVLGTAENFAWDPGSEKIQPLGSAYLRPQGSACFIQDVRDDLLSIFDLLKSEAKLFKYGSGTGTNFSTLRSKGENLEGGGVSTGLLSYLEIFDKAAQAIKSGGTTRRAAKMVVVDADHPEIMDFIRWKKNEERKARVLLANGYSGGMEGEAFRTISGQNSNNSVRLTDEFLERALKRDTWGLRSRTTGEVVEEIRADLILREMAQAAWECADPGVQFHDTIQKWHMCPASGPIRASNPCSEFMFLDNSACNLASLNLGAFWRADGFDWPGFTQAAHVMLTAQEILVDYSSYPTKTIAENSHRFRPLGLGYADLGGLLMRMGIPYDSERAAQWTARITAALHAVALERSCELAERHGPFEGWHDNREAGLEVLARHHRAWQDRADHQMEWVSQTFQRIEKQAAKTGLRNAQVTLIAPTGTIGLFMDCDTLGIEPDFSLVKKKHLVGGEELILSNRGIGTALQTLGYSREAAEKIGRHVERTGTVVGAPGLKAEDAPVFDCAMPPPGHPERRVSTEGHLRIMAAAQPFLSGAISKTVNLPATATVDDVEELFLRAWRLGLKSLAIYRDGSKSLQPLCAEC